MCKYCLKFEKKKTFTGFDGDLQIKKRHPETKAQLFVSFPFKWKCTPAKNRRQNITFQEPALYHFPPECLRSWVSCVIKRISTINDLTVSLPVFCTQKRFIVLPRVHHHRLKRGQALLAIVESGKKIWCLQEICFSELKKHVDDKKIFIHSKVMKTLQMFFQYKFS